MKSIIRTPGTTSPRHSCAIAAGLLATMMFCAASPALAANTQAPAQGTHLGVMVVTPDHSSLPRIEQKNVEVKRSALKLDLDIGVKIQRNKDNPPSIRQQSRPATKPAVQPGNTQKPLPSPSPSPADSVSVPQAQRPQNITPPNQPPSSRPVRRTPPSARHIVSPHYPRKALLNGTHGAVTVRFTIQPDGSTGNIQILSSKPPGVFEKVTRQAVREWRFNPATANGQPTAATVTQRLIFNPPGKQQNRRSQQSSREKTDIPASRVPANIHPLKIVPPKYPLEAYRARLGGSVTVKFTVGTDGEPHNIKILKADPPRTFNQAVRKAIQQWRFKPVDKPTIVIQTLSFTPPN